MNFKNQGSMLKSQSLFYFMRIKELLDQLNCKNINIEIGVEIEIRVVKR